MFKNKHGEVFVPGDQVWVWTTHHGWSNVVPGEFVGLSDTGKVKCRVANQRTVYTNKETGKIGWDYKAYEKKLIEVTIEHGHRITTLNLNRILKRVV